MAKLDHLGGNQFPYKTVETKYIDIAHIELGNLTPRQTVELNYINKLAESIQSEGQLKPIIVRNSPKNLDYFEVIDGECRIQALLSLKQSEVRAEILSLSDDHAHALALKVNQMRGLPITPIDEALHIQKLITNHDWSQGRVAETLGKSQSWVSRRLKLVTSTSAELRNAIMTRSIMKATAKEVARLPIEEQPSIIEKVKSEKLSSRDTKLLVSAFIKNPSSQDKILSEPVSNLIHLPKDIREYEEAYSAEQPKYGEYTCPQCGLISRINWVLQRIGPKIEEE